MTNPVQPVMTATKTLVASIAATATAVTTALATAQVVLADGKLDLEEYGTITTAVVTLIAGIYAVWRVPNRPVDPPQYSSRDRY